MKREQQIMQAVLNNSQDTELGLIQDVEIDSFIKGAKWADEHLKSPWISTKDHLPEIPDNRVYSDFVLIAYGKLTYIARVDRWRRWSGEDLENMRRPDFWMEIPPIPDKDE